MENFKKVKEYIEEKIQFPEKSFEKLYNAGIDAYKKQDYEKALEYFKLAVEHEDVKSQVFYNIALTYQCIKDYDRAIAIYNKFLELNPNDYDGLYNLGLAYYLKENYQKAIEIFERCVKIRKDEDGLKALILSYLSIEEIQKALNFAQTILETELNGCDLYFMMAKIFENKNSFNKDFTYVDIAIKMYSKIIEKTPNYYQAYLAISICYAKKGEYTKSVEFCKKAVEKNPDSYEANNQMGLVYYCNEEIEQAVNYYEKALKLKPNGDYKVYSNLAYAYEKNGQNGDAIRIFSQLLDKFPDFPAKDEIKNHLRILKN
ncbi:MAG: tetratricopeptide repeat protein [Candidatus Gastranaerophilales bacterium]|nr:tetratricopeptide repeat protein [Candidatus Gastranaerophilales bacterium]